MVRRALLLLVAVVLTAGLTPLVTAEQAPASVTAARATAEKSWRGGRFDEIETLAQAFPKDESIAVYHALSVAARGDYARAESILKPFVAANPGGDAALETGLLQLGVGRRTEGRQTLQLILAADRAQPKRAGLPARGPRLARHASHRRCAVVFPGRGGAGAQRSAREYRVGRPVRREVRKRRSGASRSRLRSRPIGDYGPALLGMARALADENPPQAAMFAQQALKLNPNDSGAHLLHGRNGRLPGQEEPTRRSRSSAC